MGTNCSPLLADLFLYSYESEFLQNLVKDKKIHEVRAFNFTYRYIDDVIRIIATGPCIANQLWDVNTICRRSWYIAAHIWKIYDFKIEVIPFIINFSTNLKIWFNPSFLRKCLYQIRAIAVFPVFRLLTDFVCLLTYEFCFPFGRLLSVQ
jgi:hypothetical protein